MDRVLSVLDKVVALGAFVMMPVILFIMGIIFRMKASDALRAGITVGIGFKGIFSFVINLAEFDRAFITLIETYGSIF